MQSGNPLPEKPRNGIFAELICRNESHGFALEEPDRKAFLKVYARNLRDSVFQQEAFARLTLHSSLYVASTQVKPFPDCKISKLQVHSKKPSCPLFKLLPE